MWAIDSNPNPDEQMKNEVKFRRKCGKFAGNSGDGPHVRGKVDDFCETGLWWYY
jgi:hypothetical protein